VAIAAASEPAPGSVIATAQAGGRRWQSDGSQRSFCSAVPSASSGFAKNAPWPITHAMGLSPQAISSMTWQQSRRLETPPPPYCTGSS
jgi:hypothetical protein